MLFVLLRLLVRVLTCESRFVDALAGVPTSALSARVKQFVRLLDCLIVLRDQEHQLVVTLFLHTLEG